MSITNRKAEVRKLVLERLDRLGSAARIEAGERVCRLVLTLEEWRRARSVLLFAPMPGEIDVWPLAAEAIAAGKALALPRFERVRRVYEARSVRNLAMEVEVGHFGIREPAQVCPLAPLNRLDFILAPGVAFDWHGRRLGRGKGYYDRLLVDVLGCTCGVGFDEQIVDEIPVAAHDRNLNCILTPSRCVRIEDAARH